MGVGSSVSPCAPRATTSQCCLCRGSPGWAPSPELTLPTSLVLPQNQPRGCREAAGLGQASMGSSLGCPGAPQHPEPIAPSSPTVKGETAAEPPRRYGEGREHGGCPMAVSPVRSITEVTHDVPHPRCPSPLHPTGKTRASHPGGLAVPRLRHGHPPKHGPSTHFPRCRAWRRCRRVPQLSAGCKI